MPYEPTLDLPDDETFGRVTYCAPAWAFEDRLGRERDRAEVFWPGRAVFRSNPYTAVDIDYEPPVDGKSTYSPLDSFCDLDVGDHDDGLMWSVPVNTFGRLVERLVPEGATVKPGHPLFVFEARPPTTAEWWEHYEAAREHRGEAASLRWVLRRGPLAAARWMWEDWRKQRPARKERRREGRQALKDWKAGQARERKARSSS